MENMQKMETILFPGKDSPYVVYDRTAVHSINGITPDENGDIAIELSETNLEDVALKSDVEVLQNSEANQQLVTDADGNVKWEDKTHYKKDRITLKLSPKYDKASTSSGRKWIGGTESSNPIQIAAAKTIAHELAYWLHQGLYEKWVFYWDGDRCEMQMQKWPILFEPAKRGVPFGLNVKQTGDEFVFEVMYNDDNEHTLEFELAEPELKQLDEDFIPDTIARKSDVERLTEEKMDKAQGTDNALKLLFVADDGNISTVSAESGVEVQMKGDETDESIIVNLWKPDNYEMGSYSNGGSKYAGDGTAMRSAEWIEVTPGAEYSAYFIKQPQLGMSLFFYDADGNFLEKKWAGGTLYHFTATGIKYVNFVVSSWYTKHPDDGVLPQMMLWRTTSTDIPTEYVEYGRYNKPRLLAPGVAQNAADILAVRRAAFDGQFLNIAYSTIHKGIINSTEHFMTASKLGFNTLKCDVQPTSDGELVLCHDAGYTFDDNGRILQTMDEGNNTKIITMTAAEVAALEFAGAQDAQDYYSHPCFLEDFVRICKERGKVAFITIRDDYIPDVVAPKLLEIVQKYGMVSRTIVNSFNIESLKAVRRLNNEICLHQVGAKDQVLTTARVDQINDLGNAMFGLYMHPAGTGSTVLADSAAAIEYAHRKGVRVLGAASSTYVEYNECIVNGLAGTQINRAILPYNRELLTFSVAVSGGVAAFTNTGAAERYTGEAVLSADEITVRNIKLQGSTRDFPDGILPIWMKYLPHRMEIVSNSGQTCNVTYSNHAWHITATNIAADDTYKVYIEV